MFGICLTQARDKGSVRNFIPLSRELVFDIDLTDYDPVRTSASGAKISLRCWTLMIAAVKVMDLALRGKLSQGLCEATGVR